MLVSGEVILACEEDPEEVGVEFLAMPRSTTTDVGSTDDPLANNVD